MATGNNVLKFTFQYVSINTEVGDKKRTRHSNLHSNMFLLIRECNVFRHCRSIFTFQYVSINTIFTEIIIMLEKYLHSNMFLLILGTADWTVRTFEFTFQYVSINTRDYDQRSD